MKNKQLLMILIAAVISGLVSVIGYSALMDDREKTTIVEARQPVSLVSLKAGIDSSTDFTFAAEKTINTVVNVKTQSTVQYGNPIYNFLYGDRYQHDVDQTKLKASLDQVVENCVNAVGVDLNTASMHLLTYVSGLGPQLAKNIVEFRKEQGMFSSRDDLKKVPRMGPKAFEQAAGFLRIREGKNPLDNSAVHPESYNIVEKMATDLKHPVSDLLNDDSLRKEIDIKKYINDKAGIPTLTDIMSELAKPGRDPRSAIKVFEFSPDIHSIEDVRVDMVLPGIVTNITNFGAFVDIGVKQDGLVHVSQMADRFITNPADVVKLHQHVKVKVLEVDVARKRIQLTMKGI